MPRYASHLDRFSDISAYTANFHPIELELDSLVTLVEKLWQMPLGNSSILI